MEFGTDWPFGKPTHWYESRPNYSLFLLQSELDALLSEQPAKKRPLPAAKMPELVAALRQLDDLPNRAAQLQALCNMPEFREFKITDALFREAARQRRGRLAEDRDEKCDGIREVATHEAGRRPKQTLRVNERKSVRACRAGESQVRVAQSFSSMRLSLRRMKPATIKGALHSHVSFRQLRTFPTHSALGSLVP